MPTYDYQCQACGHEWELFQSMNDSPVKSCPKCKKRKAKRLLGLGAGLIFKGTGFYETDYKNKTGGESKKKKFRRFKILIRFWRFQVDQLGLETKKRDKIRIQIQEG